MIAVWIVLVLLFGHWLADFVFQPDWMAKGKRVSRLILAIHAARIFMGMALTALVVVAIRHNTHFPAWGPVEFAATNGVAHFAIDYVTVRVGYRYWTKERMHGFFTTLGFDQFLHVAIMVPTFYWLVLR